MPRADKPDLDVAFLVLDDRERILSPLLTPSDARFETGRRFLEVFALMVQAITLFMMVYAYLAFGYRYFPWWVFLFTGGSLATKLFLDDAWDSYEVEELREGEPELYEQLDAYLVTSLEGRKG